MEEFLCKKLLANILIPGNELFIVYYLLLYLRFMFTIL